MRPTVGRIVHYVPVYAPQMGKPWPDVLPAIIIEVLDDEACRLGVFGTSGGYTVVTPVPHTEPDRDGRPVAGAWFWPPRVAW